ncbi:hypothetical protein ADL01_01490 [Streptomyces sp. NRRL WC-3618]|nr:hypothetical protein ADL01_01490 [Streptomyces sp. NRRL WC-3618]
MRGPAAFLAVGEDAAHVMLGGRAAVLRTRRPTMPGTRRFRCTGRGAGDARWHFETTTAHAAAEEMRNLATELRTFLTSTIE